MPPDAPASERRPAGRYFLALCCLAAIGIALLVIAGGPGRLLSMVADKAAELRTLAARWGWLAGLIFAAAYAGLMMMVWFPAWACTVLAGFLFGVWWGAFYTLIGATSGATAIFFLARRGLAGVVPKTHPAAERLMRAAARDRAFFYLLVLRVIPVVPFSVLNLASAAVGLRLRVFVLATFIGIIPSTFVYASLGHVTEAFLKQRLGIEKSRSIE